MNANEEFERTIAALSRVAVTSTAPAHHRVVAAGSEKRDHSESLSAELAGSVALLLTVLLPILVVALVVR